MESKTYKEIVLIRKELQAIRKCLESNFSKNEDYTFKGSANVLNCALSDKTKKDQFCPALGAKNGSAHLMVGENVAYP